MVPHRFGRNSPTTLTYCRPLGRTRGVGPLVGRAIPPWTPHPALLARPRLGGRGTLQRSSPRGMASIEGPDFRTARPVGWAARPVHRAHSNHLGRPGMASTSTKTQDRPGHPTQWPRMTTKLIAEDHRLREHPDPDVPTSSSTAGRPGDTVERPAGNSPICYTLGHRCSVIRQGTSVPALKEVSDT